jgi:uncharacterized membrane protein YukC
MKHYPPKKGIMMNETQNETFYTQEEMETVTQSAYRALVWIGVGIWAVAVTFVALIITVIAK